MAIKKLKVFKILAKNNIIPFLNAYIVLQINAYFTLN